MDDDEHKPWNLCIVAEVVLYTVQEGNMQDSVTK
jgi:hypothetical protein